MTLVLSGAVGLVIGFTAGAAFAIWGIATKIDRASKAGLFTADDARKLDVAMRHRPGQTP